MIASAPALAKNRPARILVLQKWFKILIQVIGPNTIYIGTSADEAGAINNGTLNDGLQFNNQNASLPVQIWWKGELWASASGNGGSFVIIIPGNAPNLFEAGQGQCE